MTDISVIILTGKEELHIRRCLEKLAPLEPRQVFVVESQKGDRTHDVAIEVARHLQWQVKVKGAIERVSPEATPSLRSKSLEGCEIAEGLREEGSNSAVHLLSRPTLSLFWHDWPGLYAKQFNWALDNLPIQSTWVLRLDADEYLTEDTIEKLKLCLSDDSKNITGLNIELKRRFCGGEIRHATNGIRLLRIWRTGKGRSEEREMDEHIEVGEWAKVKVEGEGERWKLVSPGSVIDFDGAFYDDNLNTMDWWREKHRGYAKREARDALAFARGEVHFKHSKELYYRQPRYLRAFIYFAIRYFLKGGFLDGYAGWMWNFWQGLWYRCLVDHEIGKLNP